MYLQEWESEREAQEVQNQGDLQIPLNIPE